MSESGSGHGSGSIPAAVGSSLLDADRADHTRLWLQSKLSGDWSAQAGASGLTEERLNALSRGFAGLDSMVKVRLLLAGLFVPRLERSRLQPLLAELASQAATNQDEWVRATAAVVGDYSGLLDMRALMTQFPLVRESVMRFSSQLAELNTPPSLLPQTEQYMHRDLSRLPAPGTSAASAAGASAAGAGGSGSARSHFRLRETPPAALGEPGQGGGGAGGGGALAGPGPGPGPGSSSGFGGGLLLLPSLGSVGVGGAGSLGLDGKGSLISGAGPSGDPLIRRGPGPGAGGETSMLRSRATLFHSKDSKQGPPTPSGKAVVGPPGLALRLNRSRSLVTPDQLLVPESPHGGVATSGAAAAASTAATPTVAAAAAAAAAATAAGHAVVPGPLPGAAGLGSAPTGAHGGASAPLPPLPALQAAQLAGPAAAAAAAAAGAPIARRDSQQNTPRGSWQGGAAAAASYQYPLAAAIAFAAAAASGEALPLTGPLASLHANSTAGELPYLQQQQQQQYPHHPQQRDCQQQQEGHGPAHDRRASSLGPYGVRGGEVSDDGFGGGDERLVGRRPSQGFERAGSGGTVARQWSTGDSGGGGGWQDGGRGLPVDVGAEYQGRGGGDEPDAKKPRVGE